MRLIGCIIAGLIVSLAPASAASEDARPRSMLVLDDANTKSPFYYELFSRLRAIVNASAGPPVSIYSESLDRSRFSGAIYEKGVQRFLQVKYSQKPIGVIVAIGSATLDYVLRHRSTLGPNVPVVFGMVDESTLARLSLPPDVTGSIMRLRFADVMTAARAVVPDLESIALVGDPLERMPIYQHWRDEIPGATIGLQVIDLTGLTMRELRQRVASLPDRTAILYTAIYSDGEGTSYVPVEALALVAMSANRPIVNTAENELGRGSVGGFLITPSLIGESAARFAMRVIEGEDPASIPIAPGEVVRPIFDWRQMQRWGVIESQLPPGSEVRFHAPTAFEQYRWLIVLAVTVLAVQTFALIGLFHEHQRRRKAEALARTTISELTYMNRLATAGELSASIAHEIAQPLTGIVLKANAALIRLAAKTPDIEEARDALSQIVSASHQASDIIRSVRAMFKKDTTERSSIDINDLISTVLAIARVDLKKSGVDVKTQLDDQLPMVEGNKVQLQQVILNLVMNAIEAMASAQPRLLTVKSERSNCDSVRVSIEDTGSGVDPSHIDSIFTPLFTTKARGMGMGLVICRSIIEAHGGRIWVLAGDHRGSIFQFELPTKVEKTRAPPSG